MPLRRYFSNDTFRFLKELQANNDRDWFRANQERYEAHVREPALRFIEDFGPHLRKISPHFLAVAKKTGGSLFRQHRDIRFSKDKSPYKTHVAVQFRHEKGKDVHVPGFYLHVEPGGVFAAMGIWHPESDVVKRVRDAIVARSAEWKKATRGKCFLDAMRLGGDVLKRSPRGYDPDHPFVEDLKRKDFCGVVELPQKWALDPNLPRAFAEVCRSGVPMMKFLCQAVGQPF